jgi:sugar O-acyltransferase (sialic acid O-acetyltransferase NeuD family)
MRIISIHGANLPVTDLRDSDMGKVIVFGNSLFAEVVYFYLTHDSSYEVVAFTVDRKYIKEVKLFGLPVVPFEDVESVFLPSECKMIVSVGFQKVNKLREERYFQAKQKGYQLINYISSKATTFTGMVIGDNCLILENAVVHPFVEIGNNVTIASGAMIGHHSVIKDHSFVAPGAIILGGVIVEPFCFIGANATVKERVKVARECIVGSGVSITKHTQERGVYVDRPPELLPKSSDELGTWLMWSLDPHKQGWGSRPREKEEK